MNFKTSATLMLDVQLYLISCVFAARADATNLKRVLSALEDPKAVLDATCVLWPELSDPGPLEFIFRTERSDFSSHDELLVSVLGCDKQLICITEMDSDSIHDRYTITKNYVKNSLQAIEKNSRFELENFESHWLRNRTILCDNMKPENTALYKPLWQAVMDNNIEFTKWVKGVVEPLIHMNSRLGNFIKIKDFEKMDDVEIFKLMLDDKSGLHTRTTITREIIPYIKFTDTYDIFLETVFTVDFFSFESYENFNLFRQLYTALRDLSSETLEGHLQEKSLVIIFENSSRFLRVISLDSLRDFLQNIDDNVPAGKHDLTAGAIKLYLTYMDTSLSGYDLKSIFAITQEEESAQAAHFASMIKNLISQIHSNPHAASMIFQVMDSSTVGKQEIFTHLSGKEKTSILIETALELGDFDLLRQFIIRYNSVVKEDVLLKYFWHFFNNASNGLSSRPEIMKAEKTLDLLLQTDSTKYAHLRVLLQVANELSQYSLNLGKGVPFKPSDILNYTSRPFDLISLLLELNQGLYKDSYKISILLRNLKIAFKTSNNGNDKIVKEEHARLLSLQIDHSLVNMDFLFAIEKTKELLTLDDSKQYWATIFQVAKFMNPNWNDGEIPTEILVFQLEITGELLHFCPIEEIEAVISHWSTLELELMTRDLIQDPYSLERQKGSENFLNFETASGISSTLSRLLSGSNTF